MCLGAGDGLAGGLARKHLDDLVEIRRRPHRAAYGVGPLVQPAHGEVAGAIHVGDRPEVCEEQGGGGGRADPLDARDGELKIELGRGGGRAKDRKVRDVDPESVAGEHDACRGVDERQVVGCVSGCVQREQ